jgi:hypothetical protein
MFTSKFSGLKKQDLIALDNGSVLINTDNGAVREFENTGVGITGARMHLIKTKSFGRTALKETIYFSDIIPRSVEVSSGRDFEKERKVSGISVLAGQGPFTSMKFEETVVQFSTEEGDYVIEIPENDKVKKKFSSLKEKKNESETKEEDDNSEPVKILRRRLAKGEISEEEFKRKKNMLEN